MEFSEFITNFNAFLVKNNENTNFLKVIDNIDILQEKFVLYTKTSKNKNLISEKSGIISRFLNEYNNKNYRISIIVKDDDEDKETNDNQSLLITKDMIKTENSEKQKNSEKITFNRPIDTKKTFSSFVVGDNSRFAYSVCQAIAKAPGLNYNPCLLHGGVGLGKTHLAQAIANEIINTLGLNVCYMACGDFLDEYGKAVGTGKINEYNSNFDNVDVWIVDDIQYLEEKGGFQEGFFNIFNNLRDKNKQIVCTSDKPTSSFKKFESRLSSRINSGIIAPLNPPDQETRFAIVKRKFNEQSFNIEDKYLKYISENLITNVRELEGTVKTIVSYCQLLEEDVNMKIINEVIKDKVIDDKESEKIDGSLIIDTVIEVLNANKKDLMSDKRTKNIVFQRDCCAYLMNTLTEMTQTEIGIMLGGKNHATIIHSVNKMKDLYQNDKKTKAVIDNLKEAIKRKAL